MQTVNDNFERFENAVKRSFAFLKTDFNYRCIGKLHRNSERPQDESLCIRYVNDKVGIEICYWSSEYSVTTAFYEMGNGVFLDNYSFYGHDGVPRAITLDTLVEYKSKEARASNLPEISQSLRYAEMCRRLDARKEIIETGLEKVIEQQANSTKRYATQILEGDTSIFVFVQRLHREKYWTAKKD